MIAFISVFCGIVIACLAVLSHKLDRLDKAVINIAQSLRREYTEEIAKARAAAENAHLDFEGVLIHLQKMQSQLDAK